MSERRVPASPESERAVLAGILLRGSELLDRAASQIQLEDFYLEPHRRIFGAMVSCARGAVDLRTVQAQLEAEGELARVGGVAYLSELGDDLPDLAGFDSYCEVIRERSLRRRLIDCATRMRRDAQDGSSVDGIEALTRAELALRALAEGSLPKASVTVGEALDRVVIELEENGGRGMVGLPTGFPDIDQKTHGLRRGNLLVIGARPGMGKTSWALNVAANLAKTGHAVGIFSLEMTDQELALRLWCSEADVSHQRLVEGYLSQGQWQKLIQTVRRVAPLPIHIDDSGNLPLAQLCARARRWSAEHRIDLLIFDHLQLMTAGGRHPNRNDELAVISRTLKQLAKELGIPVIVLSQLSRVPERRTGDHRPQLSDLRDSGAPEQDADLVAFLYRDEMYNPDDTNAKGTAEFIVRKNRSGETGTVDLLFFGDTFTFKSPVRGWTAEPPPRVSAPYIEAPAVEAGGDPF